MKLSPDSPELTAYLVGELTDGQRAEVEAALAADPVLRAELESLRRASADLGAALAAESAPALAPVQRAWLSGATERAHGSATPAAGPVASRPARPWWQWLLGFTTAAGLALIAASLLLPPPDAGSTRAAWLAARLETLRTGTNAPGGREAESLDTFRYRANEATGRKVSAAPSTGQAVGSAPMDTLAIQVAPTVPPGASAATDADPARDLLRRQQSSEPRLAARYGLAPAAEPSAGGLPGGPGAVPSDAKVTISRNVAPLASAVAPSPTPVSAARPEVELRLGTEGAPPAAAGRTLYFTPPVAGDGVKMVEQLSPSPTRPRLVTAAGEGYEQLAENPFRPVREQPLSTFGIDVDTASYANVRRLLRDGQLPPAGAVRLEEFINYFRYQDPAPTGADPVAMRVESADCPWAPGHRLVRVAVRAREIARAERPAANLVFLVDVSGSMQPENKLPLVRQTLRLLVERLTPRDSVAIVTYAGSAGVALEPTPGSDKAAILRAIDGLKSGGSTHGSAGITTAYDLAVRGYREEGVNRVLLCTDGDFNVGLTSREELLDLITAKARTGVFLSVLGYGVGNFQDRTTELLADRGNGNYAYIDGFREAARVLDEQLEATLVTVAKDVKIQVEFNPARVASWRLLGYENRLLADRDFNDDTKDGGEMGAGHAVTALYEVVPVGGTGLGVDPLRYAAAAREETARVDTDPARASELLHLKLRYKLPDADTSRLLSVPVADAPVAWEAASADFRFSAAAAGFGMLLRGSAHRGTLDHAAVLRMAEQGLGADPGGYRAEMVDLIRRARSLSTGR